MLKPLEDRVVIEIKQKEEQTVGSLVLAPVTDEKPNRGTVLAVGDGKMLADGKRAAMIVKVGDHVVFDKFAGAIVRYNDQDYLIIRESEILAIIE